MSKKKKKDYNSYVDRPALKPQTPKQAKYINAIRNMSIVVGTGYPGTGKSYIPAVIAADMLAEGKVDKLVICRPNVGVGKTIGLLKGDLVEKMRPWCAPILDVLETRLGKSYVQYLVERGVIELLPLEYARGKSFDNAFVILDEAQNVDKESLKCLMLRLGRDSKLVIDGDVNQCDIGESTGLSALIKLMNEYHMPATHVNFDIEDIVRSDICKYLIKLFDEAKF
jgi:phosphate starvation-inducible PhoH-like protein